MTLSAEQTSASNSENLISLSAADEKELAELVVSVGVHVFDASRVSRATLRREDEGFLATAEFNGREFQVRVTREEIFATLGREII